MDFLFENWPLLLIVVFIGWAIIGAVGFVFRIALFAFVAYLILHYGFGYEFLS